MILTRQTMTARTPALSGCRLFVTVAGKMTEWGFAPYQWQSVPGTHLADR